jgi:hypothetical protein
MPLPVNGSWSTLLAAICLMFVSACQEAPHGSNAERVGGDNWRQPRDKLVREWT